MARPKKNKELEVIDDQYEIEKKEKSYIDTKVNDMLQNIEQNKENLAESITNAQALYKKLRDALITQNLSVRSLANRVQQLNQLIFDKI